MFCALCHSLCATVIVAFMFILPACSLPPQGLRTCSFGSLGYFWYTHPLAINSLSFNLNSMPLPQGNISHLPLIALSTMSSSFRRLNLVSDFPFCTYLINISSIIQMLSSTWIWAHFIPSTNLLHWVAITFYDFKSFWMLVKALWNVVNAVFSGGGMEGQSGAKTVPWAAV